MNHGTKVHAEIDLPCKEEPIKASFMGLDGKIITVGGVMDGFDSDKNIIYELKTANHIEDRYLSKPKPEHVYQVEIYKFLHHLLGREVNKAKFWYMSNNDWKSFEINLNLMTEKDVERDYQFYKFCVDNRVEGPRPEAMKWACSYCDYWRFCPYSRNVFKSQGIRPDKILKPACRECDKIVDVSTALKELPRRII
jgi:CRISPR/Cas system-associated exonuclease Cas4 (RecB family)